MELIEKGRPVKIAYIIGKMWAGGVEKVVFNYYREINKELFQIDFFYDEDSTVDIPQDLIDMGAKFIKLPPYQKINKYLPALYKQLKKEKYDIIHSHINTLSVFPLFVAFLAGVKIRIAHNHSVPGNKEFFRDLLKRFLKLFARVFATNYCACSEKAGVWLFGKKKFYEKGIVIPNAVNLKNFDCTAYQTDIEDIKRKYNLENKFVIGNVGRFTYAKNHKFLLDIFKNMYEKDRNSVLILVGDGELHDDIVNKINSLNIQNNTILIGNTTRPEMYYHLMNVVIIPSVFEGLSMVTVEAQISKVPVVVSEAIPDEAIISDSGVRKMLLSDSPQEWASNAIEVATEKIRLNDNYYRYNIKNSISLLEEYYKKLLEE